jgi:predicted transcriptional regulator
LLQNAGRSAQFARVQERLTGMTVADAVTPNSPIIREDITLREFVDQRTLTGSNWQKFLVTNEAGQLVGELALSALNDVRSDRWAHTLVSEIMHSVEPSTIIISDRPLLQAIEQLESKHVTTLSVTDSDGLLVGLLEKAAVINLLHNRQPQVNPA